MKRRVRIMFLPLAFVLFHQAVLSMEAVAECRLGKGGTRKVQLWRDQPIDATAIYYLSENGSSPRRIYAGEENQSRGGSVQASMRNSPQLMASPRSAGLFLEHERRQREPLDLRVPSNYCLPAKVTGSILWITERSKPVAIDK